MNSLVFSTIVLGGAFLGFAGLFIAGKISANKALKKQEKERQAAREKLKSESDRRKQANEQKESMETGSGVSDFAASIAAVDELRKRSGK